ncbi:AAA+-type ATPase [Saxophila tyrrhenica]|uniref:AAA+-type ATPase n=1 Tax=Saxophila tyrrhenica TaxID=1690608 RepID=A0AAV9PCU9_9PEZI|nr:AAA+-type ATPase [Saxophila tyrrhenica]
MAQPLVVKSLPGSQGLDGAFRLHLSQESLDAAGLKLGEICEITKDDSVTVGHAIAWRAADRARSSTTGAKPVAMSQMLRSAFNVLEGSLVHVRRTTAPRAHATKVVLRDITMPENVPGGNNPDDGKWKANITYHLVHCEAFTHDVTFDVAGKSKAKRRFQVEKIETTDASCSLFYADDRTEFLLNDGSVPEDTNDVNGHEEGMLLNCERIGGLVRELKLLNKRMQRVLTTSHESLKIALGRNTHDGILLHGFEGTGKSFLLEQLGNAPFRRVVRLDVAYLAGTAIKTQEKVRSAFHEARSCQPSLISIDDIHKIAGTSDDVVAETLRTEMNGIQSDRVLVVATCIAPNDIHRKLFGRGGFTTPIELPVPDRDAREAILNVMFKTTSAQPGISSRVALRTHGFTGKDLEQLTETAGNIAFDSCIDPVGDDSDTLTNGLPDGPSQASEENEQDAALVTMDDIELALKSVRPTALREIIFEPPKIGWQDIGGSTAIKARFDRAIDWPIRHAEVLKKYGKRSDKGILLYGPPGCSKTLTAQAVASHYGLNFLPVKGGELISMYVGESERKVRELFKKARAAAPCVIFFDEIDSIASERSSEGSKGLNVLTTLLTEMDGFETLNGVLVLAATNKPDLLDPAIMRPGRFNSHIYLGPPNAAARREIFGIKLRDVPKEDGLDMDKVVDESDGFSGAEIIQICESAVGQASAREIEGTKSVTSKLCTADLETALAHQKKSIKPEMLASYEAFEAS